MSDPAQDLVTYELLDEGTIARITLNRAERRNAQNRELLAALDEAFLRAEADDQVRVAILAGAGPVFSSGHDFTQDWRPSANTHPTYLGNGGTRGKGEELYLQEWRYYFQNTLRWRNLRKITIASVQGGVYSAALMLMWACDLIVAAEGTVFADMVGNRFGMCGVEYFAHPFEFGPRLTKELMLTGDSIDADEAHRLGMVNKVFPADELEERTLEFARRIARIPTMAALLVKEAVNQTVDIQGQHNSLNACFTLHELNHMHWRVNTVDDNPSGPPEAGLPPWDAFPPVLPRERDTAAAEPRPKRS
jgi:enoyl-CoA hydratase